MGLGVLGPRFRQRPKLAREIDFLPLQAGNLFAPLSGERQKLNNPAVRACNFSSGEDDLGELIVVQHSVASDLLRRQWHALGWGLIEDGPTHAPAQEGLDRLQGFVSGYRRPPLLDGGDDLDDIALANLVDAPAGPGLAHLPAEQPRNLAPRAVL
jgi:hypothetical protein